MFPAVREQSSRNEVTLRVFDFTADHTAEGPQLFLQGYTGYLQADALAQYEGFYDDDKVKHVCCWAHARRKFMAAAEAGDERANTALELIRQLYAIERDWSLSKTEPCSAPLGR